VIARAARAAIVTPRPACVASGWQRRAAGCGNSAATRDARRAHRVQLPQPHAPAAARLLASCVVDEALRHRARAARADVVSGALRGAALAAALRSIPLLDRDAWLDELLGIEPPPPDVPDLPRGAVPYLPCGVEELLALVAEAPVEHCDDLVDLGAGLGRAAILCHLLSGARASGIEIQAPLVDRARTLVAGLGLAGDQVSFACGDAGAIDLDGSVFFLYAPCNGEMFARLVRRLEDVARRRPIAIAAVGVELPAARWLTARATSCAQLTLYDAG
jgi:SAM-dependent methyltransferase